MFANESQPGLKRAGTELYTKTETGNLKDTLISRQETMQAVQNTLQERADDHFKRSMIINCLFWLYFVFIFLFYFYFYFYFIFCFCYLCLSFVFVGKGVLLMAFVFNGILYFSLLDYLEYEAQDNRLGDYSYNNFICVLKFNTHVCVCEWKN